MSRPESSGKVVSISVASQITPTVTWLPWNPVRVKKVEEKWLVP